MMIISGLLGIHITTTKALRAVMLLAVALGAGAVFGQGGRKDTSPIYHGTAIASKK
jgi:hypothetical protein